MFRVPRDHDGRGLVCPSCRRLLKIPRPGDVTPPLLAEGRRLSASTGLAPAETDGEGDAVVETATGGHDGRVRLQEKQRVSKRRSSSSHGEGPRQSSWEHGTSSVHRFRKLDSVRMGWMLGGGAVLFCLIVVGVMIVLKSVPIDDMIASGVKVTGARPLPLVDKRSDASILVEAESLARDFLNATTVEEVLPVVRNPEQARLRMAREYPDGRLNPPGMAEFNPGKALMRGTVGFEVSVRTRTFELRPLNLVETPAGLRIDWESWVEWSEMAWPEFLGTKPTTAQAFRVVVRKVDYYNFNFADDSKWRSFLLESRKGERRMYGYVERGSDLAQRIQIAPELKSGLFILKVRFPEGAEADSNQVLIEEVVHDSWVEPD